MTTQELDSILIDAGINVPTSTKNFEDSEKQINSASGDNQNFLTENSAILANHKTYVKFKKKKYFNLNLDKH